MYELIRLTECSYCSYYIQSPEKAGLIRLDDTQVCLIDSGNDKDAGRRLRQLLDARGWRLTAIYNTRSNTDHIGGNRYLQGQTGCGIYVPGIECAFTRPRPGAQLPLRQLPAPGAFAIILSAFQMHGQTLASRNSSFA